MPNGPRPLHTRLLTPCHDSFAARTDVPIVQGSGGGEETDADADVDVIESAFTICCESCGSSCTCTCT
ncbi:unnamed protein product [Soboliphyme baturini]|uniref:FxLD family lantipeptide n=1 Tax=Soboliphyme baturini TaxID=241478 RepID=A0A183IUS9_9BILA|nr:unnamed protein product [Soboliphyme baturini]